MGRQRAAGRAPPPGADQRRRRHLDERRRQPGRADDRLRPARRHLHHADRAAARRRGSPRASPTSMQPRFSPDGRRIAFTSDRGGGDNIWVMNADGSRQAPAHQGGFPPAQPADLEPGRPLHRRQEAFHHRPLARHRRDLALPRLAAAAACRWSSGPTSSTRRSWASRPSRPTARRSISRRNATPGADLRICPGFEHQSVRHRALRPRHRRGDHGRVRRRRRGAADAVARRQVARLRPPRARPSRSSTSRTSPPARSARSTTISTRTCRRPGRSPASIRTWTGRPTAAAIVFWAGGKIRRVDADGGGAREIPFQVNDTRVVDRRAAPAGRGRARPLHDQDAALRRGLARRPPGACSRALGKLWVKPIGGGAPRRLTAATSGSFELFPSWSRDGQHDRLRRLERRAAWARSAPSRARRRRLRAT